MSKLSKVESLCSWPCTFSNFSKLPSDVGHKLNSAPFTMGGYEFEVLVYPGGIKECAKGWVSVFLKLCRPIVAVIKFSLSIINLSGKKMRTTGIITNEYGPNGSNQYCHGYAQFVQRDLLTKTLAVTNDQLIILCEVFDLNLSDTVYQFKKLRSYENHLNNDAFSDIKIIVDGKVIHAHKMLLCNENETFAELLRNYSDDDKKNLLIVEDIEFDVMLELVRFIYVGNVKRMENIAQKLLLAADKYNMRELKLKCERYLCQSLSVSNVLENVIFAEKHSLNELKVASSDFFVKNKKAVARTDGFECKVKMMGLNLMSRLFANVCES